MDEIPTHPDTVRLDYPDGSQLQAGWRYAGPDATDHERYIVRLPASARVVNGMVIHADRDVTLAVEVVDHLPLHLRNRGGAQQ